MIMLNTLLVALLFVTSLAVVQVKNETRQAFVRLEQLQQQRDDMHIEWGKMQLEQSTYSGHSRIDHIARNELKMVVPQEYAVIKVTR
ncbi:cell division protein FtsL [Ectothiorhodospiraceae bacterium BW-2]|nr:cell division protein FtsL [Ectothiorhodospiraceae bacterium BW-2]